MDYFLIRRLNDQTYYTWEADPSWNADRARARRFMLLEECLEVLWGVKLEGGPRAYVVLRVNANTGHLSQVWPT